MAGGVGEKATEYQTTMLKKRKRELDRSPIIFLYAGKSPRRKVVALILNVNI
jgi:hypothetical protein